MEQFECVKCGHSWYPRRPGRPMQCPGCKCRKWWEPKGGLKKMWNVKKSVEVEDVAK